MELSMRRLVLFLLPLLIASVSLAQSSSALINEALDKQVALKFRENTPLPQVMQAITKDTGVPLIADPSVYELLPWGEQTGLTVQIENQTLREALAAMTRTLGLTFVLKPESVEIRPMPALRRLGRRATPGELEVLNLLASTPAELKTDRPSAKDLLAAVDAKLEAAKSPVAIENRAFDDASAATPVPVAKNATLMDALESLAETTSATWHPWGKTLVVIPKEEHVRSQLAREISIRYNDVDIAKVLTELSARSGVPFTIEPGAVQNIPPEARKVSLILDNTSVQQALEYIGGFTGLAYVVNDKGVYLFNKAGAAAGARRDPVVAIIRLDSGAEVLIPESEVPADVREYLKHKRKRAIDALRDQMIDEGFKPPATQPATAPSKRSEDL
jgi:type II secretory pathway component GspD/PulD (secretin)